MRIGGPITVLALLCAAPQAGAQAWIGPTATPDAFAMSTPDGTADIVYDPKDAAVVSIAAHDLSEDITRVTDRHAPVVIRDRALSSQQIWIGTVGHSSIIDSLVKSGKIDATPLTGAWESYIIATVDHPAPGVAAALVIAGSDRRGTAYGVYEVSKAMGVSPWVWWADVAPAHKDALYVAAGTHKFGPPSVKYRGIFINDEDWGLTPWSSQTLDPKGGNVGPRTYAHVFELLLRLKADTLWPAMHKVTKPFNDDPQNAKLADRYAIVMGSSHAEPMLRNNVGEWKADPETFNYATNPEGVKAYWAERLKANGSYENIYTLGMRGIHDSAMQGADTPEAKQRILNQVIADQRQLLKNNVSTNVETVPQVFVPYKEVLDVYNHGLDLPDDVTVMWPDDNFGYIRHFPTPAEQKRSGGSGVYYHLSYLGAPLSYIWLSTTPPGLIREEMTRAFDAGADRMWIANVGDIKPAEVDLSYFMDLAWDVPNVRKMGPKIYLRQLAAQTFGWNVAEDIGETWDSFYRFNATRRPEHLQYWLPKEAPKASPLNGWDIAFRGQYAQALSDDVDEAKTHIRPSQNDAFYELVEYPIKASILANTRYFALECAYTDAVKACDTGRNAHADPLKKPDYIAEARAAEAALTEMTRVYNNDIAHGKWRLIMQEEPADTQWTSFRLSKPVWPEAGGKMAADVPVAHDDHIELSPVGDPPNQVSGSGWVLQKGMGRHGNTMRALTATSPPLVQTTVVPEGVYNLSLSLLPTYPTDGSPAWKLGVQIDDGAIEPLSFDRSRADGYWAQGVLNNRLTQPTSLIIKGGRHVIKVYAYTQDAMVESIDLTRIKPQAK